jgi:hypothetical protein
VEEARSHQSVNWYDYFKSIKTECPWSYSAYLKGEIHISEYTGEILPLGRYQARVYTVTDPTQSVEALSAALDHGDDEWLFSFPGYGPFATPVPVLIQQDRKELNRLRHQLKD